MAIDITVVLDRSGSMSSIQNDTVGGVNSFIAEQQTMGHDARLTLHLFDHEHTKLYDNAPIAHCQPLTAATYAPRGWTALLDAIWNALNDANERLTGTDDSAVLVIVTDGHENASLLQDEVVDGVLVTKKQRVFRRVEEWRARGRAVTFLGANQDAIAEGEALGVPMAGAMTFTAGSVGTASTFRSLSRAVSSYRIGENSAARGQSSISYSAEDRTAATMSDVPLTVTDDDA